MKKLIGGTVAVAAVYAGQRLGVGDNPAPTDPYILLLSGIALGGVIATLIYPWRTWGLRRVGLLFVTAAFTIFCLATFWGYEWGLTRATIERLNDLILALLIVGAPLLIIGVLTYQVGLLRGTAERDGGGMAS